MTLIARIGQAIRAVSGRSGLRLLTVKDAWFLTPNMIRVVFAGSELARFPEGHEGGNCKLLIPDLDEPQDHFAQRLRTGTSLIKCTYTMCKFDPATLELTIDFVAHGDNGPASRWHAAPRLAISSVLRGQARPRSCASMRIGI